MDAKFVISVSEILIPRWKTISESFLHSLQGTNDEISVESFGTRPAEEQPSVQSPRSISNGLMFDPDVRSGEMYLTNPLSLCLPPDEDGSRISERVVHSKSDFETIA